MTTEERKAAADLRVALVIEALANTTSSTTIGGLSWKEAGEVADVLRRRLAHLSLAEAALSTIEGTLSAGKYEPEHVEIVRKTLDVLRAP